MRKFIFLTVLVVVGTLRAHAQQDAQFSYFMYNSLYFNPANAGIENLTRFTAIHRSQWAFYQSDFDDGGAPQTQVISLSSPIFKLKSGFGGHIVRDQLGNQSNLEVQGAYAYHLGIKQAKISLGVRFGFVSQSYDFSKYRYIDGGDPILSSYSGIESQVRPDMAAGIMFMHEKYYAGVSFTHLLKSTFDFGLNDTRNALTNHMYINGGFYYNLSTAAKFNFPVLFQTDFNQYNFTVGTIMTMMERNKEKMWAGVMVRQSEDVGLMLGYHFLKDKSLRVGYSFGYIFKDQAAKEPTSHEFILIYELPPIGPVDKKQQHTPRFRH